MGNHCINKGNRRHVREVRQGCSFETHLDEFAVERWIVHTLPDKDKEPRRIESRLRKKGAQGVLLTQVERRCAESIGLALISDIRGNFLSNPVDLSGA